MQNRKCLVNCKMSLIKITDDLKKIQDKETRTPFSRFEYVFEPGTKIENYPGIKFYGFIPDNNFGNYFFELLGEYEIEGKLDILLANDEYAKSLLGKKDLRMEHAINTGNYIGEKEDVEEFLKWERKPYETASDMFIPAEATPTKRSFLLVNLDSNEPKEGLKEGLLHYLTEKNGWLDELHKAYNKAEDAFLVTNIEYKILGTVRESMGDILCSAIAVQKEDKEFVHKKVTGYLEGTIKNNPNNHLRNLSKTPLDSYFFLLDVCGQSTVPSNYPDRNHIKKHRVTPKREVLLKYLHPEVKNREEEIDEIFWDLQIPPSEKNIWSRYKDIFDIYFEIPD